MVYGCVLRATAIQRIAGSRPGMMDLSKGKDLKKEDFQGFCWRCPPRPFVPALEN